LRDTTLVRPIAKALNQKTPFGLLAFSNGYKHLIAPSGDSKLNISGTRAAPRIAYEEFDNRPPGATGNKKNCVRGAHRSQYFPSVAENGWDERTQHLDAISSRRNVGAACSQRNDVAHAHCQRRWPVRWLPEVNEPRHLASPEYVSSSRAEDRSHPDVVRYWPFVISINACDETHTDSGRLGVAFSREGKVSRVDVNSARNWLAVAGYRAW
jgi:hypothetical protein